MVTDPGLTDTARRHRTKRKGDRWEEKEKETKAAATQLEVAEGTGALGRPLQPFTWELVATASVTVIPSAVVLPFRQGLVQPRLALNPLQNRE